MNPPRLIALNTIYIPDLDFSRAVYTFNYSLSSHRYMIGISNLNMLQTECLDFPPKPLPPAVFPITLLPVALTKLAPSIHSLRANLVDYTFQIHPEPDHFSVPLCWHQAPSHHHHKLGFGQHFLTVLPTSTWPPALSQSSQTAVLSRRQRLSLCSELLLSFPAPSEDELKASLPTARPCSQALHVPPLSALILRPPHAPPLTPAPPIHQTLHTHSYPRACVTATLHFSPAIFPYFVFIHPFKEKKMF